MTFSLVPQGSSPPWSIAAFRRRISAGALVLILELAPVLILELAPLSCPEFTQREPLSGCVQGSMMEWGGSLYFSNPRSTTARTNMSVMRSETDGMTWLSHAAVSAPGVPASYSCLVELPTPAGQQWTPHGASPHGTVGVMWERGTDDCVGAACEIVFTTLPPSRFAPIPPPLKLDDGAAAADTQAVATEAAADGDSEPLPAASPLPTLTVLGSQEDSRCELNGRWSATERRCHCQVNTPLLYPDAFR